MGGVSTRTAMGSQRGAVRRTLTCGGTGRADHLAARRVKCLEPPAITNPPHFAQRARRRRRQAVVVLPPSERDVERLATCGGFFIAPAREEEREDAQRERTRSRRESARAEAAASGERARSYRWERPSRLTTSDRARGGREVNCAGLQASRLSTTLRLAHTASHSGGAVR